MTFDEISALKRRLEGVLIDALGVDHAEAAHKEALEVVAAINAGENARHVCAVAALRVYVHLVERLTNRLHDETRRALVKEVAR